jgi:hypothetical protein
VVLDVAASRGDRRRLGSEQSLFKVAVAKLGDGERDAIVEPALLRVVAVGDLANDPTCFGSGRLGGPRRAVRPNLVAALAPVEAILDDIVTRPSPETRAPNPRSSASQTNRSVPAADSPSMVRLVMRCIGRRSPVSSRSEPLLCFQIGA